MATKDFNKAEISKALLACQQKAGIDQKFRNELLADPKHAIKALTGVELPEDFKIKVIESDPNFNATLLLPPYKNGEINDNDLKNVSGGGGDMWTDVGNFYDGPTLTFNH